MEKTNINIKADSSSGFKFKFTKILKWTLIIIVGAYVVGVIWRIPYVYNQKKTNEAVLKIHAARLTLSDVMGENLPPEPDPTLKDATIEGIDANNNGIRDDVELAIFKEYPNSAKIRAALLQYAMALQMEMTQSIVNRKIVGEVSDATSRATQCISDLVPRKTPDSSREYSDIEKINAYEYFIESKQLNTDQRKNQKDDFYSFTIIGEIPISNYCDINLNSLPN